MNEKELKDYLDDRLSSQEKMVSLQLSGIENLLKDLRLDLKDWKTKVDEKIEKQSKEITVIQTMIDTRKEDITIGAKIASWAVNLSLVTIPLLIGKFLL